MTGGAKGNRLPPHRPAHHDGDHWHSGRIVRADAESGCDPGKAVRVREPSAPAWDHEGGKDAS